MQKMPIFALMKEFLAKYSTYIVVAVAIFMGGSLYYDWLNPFFFGSEHAQVQGIDYFALPKSYLNLLNHRSIYDTWGGESYGPYSTWYLAHPAFSVFIASWFAYFSPWISYTLFIVFSFLLLLISAYLIAKFTSNVIQQNLIFLLFLGSFPVYWTLYVGNMHVPLMLALVLILLGIYEMTYSENIKAANRKLLAGLLICLFTKPIVLLMLPLLLLVKETRKITFQSLLIYFFISIVFIVIPFFNPQAIGWNQIITIAYDFDFIKQNLNIFKNNFVLNEYMKDNSIHWLNLIAQSDYKFMHIDVFSLPVFVDTFLGHEVSSKIFKLPIYLTLLCSIGVGCINDRKIRLENTLLLVMAISLTFFLSYNTVWEYQYASVVPVISILLILRNENVFYKKYILFLIIIGILICLPSGYILVRNGDFQSPLALSIIRFSKVIPVLIMFVVMIFVGLFSIKKYMEIPSLRKINKLPSKMFFN